MPPPFCFASSFASIPPKLVRKNQNLEFRELYVLPDNIALSEVM